MRNHLTADLDPRDAGGPGLRDDGGPGLRDAGGPGLRDDGGPGLRDDGGPGSRTAAPDIGILRPKSFQFLETIPKVALSAVLPPEGIKHQRL